MAEDTDRLGDGLVTATAACALVACLAGLLREPARWTPTEATSAPPPARATWVRIPTASPATADAAAPAATPTPASPRPEAPEAPAALPTLGALPTLAELPAGQAAAGATTAPRPLPAAASGAPTRLGRDALGGAQPWPEYPAAARRRGETGTVTVRLTVGADGSVRSARATVSSGWRSLDEAATDTIRRRWSFPPGEPRDHLVDIRFELL